MKTLKEKIIDLSDDLREVPAANLMKVALHFAKNSAANWEAVWGKLKLQDPRSKAYQEAAMNWQQALHLQTKILEAAAYKSYFDPTRKRAV